MFRLPICTVRPAAQSSAAGSTFPITDPLTTAPGIDAGSAP